MTEKRIVLDHPETTWVPMTVREDELRTERDHLVACVKELVDRLNTHQWRIDLILEKHRVLHLFKESE